MNFALLEIKITLVMILKYFDEFSTSTTPDSLEFKENGVRTIIHNLNLKFG